MQRRALICGISGQDGAYLAHFLLSRNYEVWGTSRQVQSGSFEKLKALGIFDRLKILEMLPENYLSVLNVLSFIRPQEIYNLAGQSSVGLSFEQPIATMASIATGNLNQLEAIRAVDKSIRYYFAGSGECFGATGAVAATELSAFRPQSPYAVAKAAATCLVSVYRDSYDLFACTGMLFNHESPLRSERFVTMKIVLAAKRIASGSGEKLKLGNIDIRRDWGWAPEYVDTMWRMLNADEPRDFVIATGVTLSLREFVGVVFDEAGLDWRDHVIADPTLLRPNDPLETFGDARKAKAYLNWVPVVVGAQVPRMMFKNAFLNI